MVRVLGAEVQVAYLLSIRVALAFDSLALRGRRVADASKGPSSAHAHFGAKHFPSPRARRQEAPRGGSAVLEVDPACPAHDRHGLLCVGVCRSLARIRCLFILHTLASRRNKAVCQQ